MMIRRLSGQHAPSTRPRGGWRKGLVALAALLPILSVLVVTAPADAHTQNMSVSSSCQTDGTYKLTYTLTYANGAPNGKVYHRTGTTSFSNGLERVELQRLVLAGHGDNRQRHRLVVHHPAGKHHDRSVGVRVREVVGQLRHQGRHPSREPQG